MTCAPNLSYLADIRPSAQILVLVGLAILAAYAAWRLLRPLFGLEGNSQSWETEDGG